MPFNCSAFSAPFAGSAAWYPSSPTNDRTSIKGVSSSALLSHLPNRLLNSMVKPKGAIEGWDSADFISVVRTFNHMSLRWPWWSAISASSAKKVCSCANATNSGPDVNRSKTYCDFSIISCLFFSCRAKRKASWEMTLVMGCPYSIFFKVISG
jgi:hypothetical protein